VPEGQMCRERHIAERRVSIDRKAAQPIEIIESEQPAYARTGGDVVRVVAAFGALLFALLLAAVFRASVSGANSDVTNLAKTVPGPLQTALRLVSQYVGLIGGIGLVIALVVIRRLRVAVTVLIAVGAGALAMYGVTQLLSLDVSLPFSLGQLRGV